LFNHIRRANCLQQRFAIALPQLPPNSELLAAALRYRTLQLPNSDLNPSKSLFTSRNVKKVV